MLSQPLLPRSHWRSATAVSHLNGHSVRHLGQEFGQQLRSVGIGQGEDGPGLSNTDRPVPGQASGLSAGRLGLVPSSDRRRSRSKLLLSIMTSLGPQLGILLGRPLERPRQIDGLLEHLLPSFGAVDARDTCRGTASVSACVVLLSACFGECVSSG